MKMELLEDLQPREGKSASRSEGISSVAGKSWRVCAKSLANSLKLSGAARIATAVLVGRVVRYLQTLCKFPDHTGVVVMESKT